MRNRVSFGKLDFCHTQCEEVTEGSSMFRWFRRRRSNASAVFISAPSAGSRMPFNLRLQLLWAQYRHRNKFNMKLDELGIQHGFPSFYEPAKPSDVEGFVIDDEIKGVGNVVPCGYESYVGLPNPAWKWVEPGTEGATPEYSGSGREELWSKPVKWVEVAEANGKSMNKRVWWSEISGPSTEHGQRALSPDQPWTWAPHEQGFEPNTANILFEILLRKTSRDDRCLCGKWEGGSSGWETDVKIAWPSWEYFVWSCRFGDLIDWLNEADSFHRDTEMPHVVWPEDRSWFLSILYSGYWNYVAGSRELIDEVLSTELETYEVELSDHAH